MRLIDGVWHAIGSQLRNPRGAAGSIVGWLMAWVNDEPNRLAIDALDPRPGETLLELGFGPGWGLRTIAERGVRVYGVDQSARMLEQAKRMNEVAISRGRMVLLRGPFSPLPWIDGMFDKVLAVNVAYFFDSDGRDLAEVHRVLRSGGRLVIYATSRRTMEKWPFAGPDTHRTFDAHDLARLLADAGFARSHIAITNAELALGVKGLIAVAEKSERFGRCDEQAQGFARRSGFKAVRQNASVRNPTDWATFGNRGRSWEQGSVANDRHEPDEFGGASKRDARDNRSDEG